MGREPAEQVLRELLASEYGIVVRDCVSLKSVTGIVATSGERFIWKPVSSLPTTMSSRLDMIDRVAGLLSRNGFTAAYPIPNRRREWLTATGDGFLGYVQPWLPGRHINLANPQERLSAVATVGHLHHLSKLWPLAEWGALSGPQLVDKIAAKRQACMRVWPSVTSRCKEVGDIESVVMPGLDAGYQAAFRLLELTGYGSAIGGDTLFAFCHRDLAPHNLLWTDDRLDVSLIDFDLAGVDHPFIDLVQLANHALFLTDPRPGLLRDLVSVHQRTAGWPESVESVIWQLLRFPDLLVRALVEWVNTGYSASGRAKVITATEKERMRHQVWTRDWHDHR